MRMIFIYLILGGERVCVYAISMEHKYHKMKLGKQWNLCDVVQSSCKSRHAVYALVLHCSLGYEYS